MKIERTQEDRTEEIRATLTFLQFLENKIIKKQVYKRDQYLEEIDGFSKFISLYMK